MGGFCPICKIYWGGFCPSQQKRVGGILSGGDFVRIPAKTLDESSRRGSNVAG